MSTAYCIKPANGKIRPIVRIANSLGIEVRRTTRKELEGRFAVLEYVNGNYYILEAEDISIEERRLSIAHELSHAILGNLLYDESESYRIPIEQMEFEAETLGFILYNFLYGIDGGRKPI